MNTSDKPITGETERLYYDCVEQMEAMAARIEAKAGDTKGGTTFAGNLIRHAAGQIREYADRIVETRNLP